MREYDLIIVGAGITGSAILYTISKYTNIKRVAVIEKYSSPGQVSSKSNNNSQTLHFGDIETNYTLKKAKQVKEWASMLANYMQEQKDSDELYKIMPKMVLAVGEEEISLLKKRYEEFRLLFPKLKLLLTREEIAAIEPKVVYKRDEKQKIAALYAGMGYAADFGKITESFIKNAKKNNPDTDFYLSTKLKKIQKTARGYTLITNKGSYRTKVLVVCSAGHSFLFARQVGLGKNLTVLPVAGTFYFAPEVLNGKVYMMQIKKLPFAAVHGDKEVTGVGGTRFGPIARIMPMLERKDKYSIINFFRSFGLSIDAWKTYFTIITDKVYAPYVFRNILYDMPIIGPRLFIKQVNKIVPSLKHSDLKRAVGYGEIRPQIADIKKRKMIVGSAKITGKKAIFNITPSPGASVCLANAYEDVKTIMSFLDDKKYFFDEKKLRKDLIDKKPAGYP